MQATSQQRAGSCCGCSTSGRGVLPGPRSQRALRARLAPAALRNGGAERARQTQMAEFVDMNEAAFVADPGAQPDPGAGQEELLLHSAIDKQYRQKLREFRRMATPEAVRELRDSMPPDALPFLEAALADALSPEEGGGGASSWDEGDVEFTQQESLLLERLQAQAQALPDDLTNYLVELLPDDTTREQRQQLLALLEESVVEDLRSVYDDMRDFYAADMDNAQIADRYLELTQRLERLTEQLEERRQEGAPGFGPSPAPAQLPASAGGPAEAQRQWRRTTAALAPDAQQQGRGRQQPRPQDQQQAAEEPVQRAPRRQAEGAAPKQRRGRLFVRT